MTSHDFTWDSRFDKAYFEYGALVGKSLYENYRWMPERTFIMAEALYLLYPGCSILDFGCAKGFLVRALRQLGIEAYGFDVSKYALANATTIAKPFLYGPGQQLPEVDLVFAKDVFEHVGYKTISSVLEKIALKTKYAFFIIPFGEDERYRVPAYENDITHIIRENEGWWNNTFVSAGFMITKFSYHVPGFKDKWRRFRTGNGFYFLQSMRKEKGARDGG